MRNPMKALADAVSFSPRHPAVHRRTKVPTKTVKAYAKHHGIDIDPIDSCTNVWPPQCIQEQDPFDDHYAEDWDQAMTHAHVYASIKMGLNPDRCALVCVKSEKVQRIHETLAALALRLPAHAPRLKAITAELLATNCMSLDKDSRLECELIAAAQAKHHVSADLVCQHLSH